MSDYPKPPATRLGKMRDRTAYLIFLLAFKVATPWYGGMISGAVRYGLAAAVRDSDAAERSGLLRYDED